jgi:hypothetical protein
MSWLNRLGFNTIDLRGRFLLHAAQRENLLLRNAAKTLLWPECQVEEVAEALNQIEFPSRFAADDFFSLDKVREMYSRWVLGGLEGNMSASAFRGLRRRGRITALAYAQEMTVGYGATARSVYGRILAGAVPGKGSDCYYVINDMTADCLTRCDWVEAVISLNNRVPVKSVHSMGYRLHATELVLHARIEP